MSTPWQHCIATGKTNACLDNGSNIRLPWQYHIVSLITLSLWQRIYDDNTVSVTTLSLWQHCHYDNTVTMNDNITLSRLTTVPDLRTEHYTVTMAISQRFLDRTVTMTTMSLWKLCQNDNTVTLTTLHCHGWQCSVVNGSITRLPWQYHNVSLTGLSLWQHCHYDNSVNMTTQLPWQHYIVTVDNSTCFANGSITRLPWQYHNVSLTGLSLWQHCHYDNTVTMTTLHCHGWQQYLFCEWQHYTVTMAISQRFLDRTVTMTTLSLRQHSYHDNTTLSRLTTVPVLRMAALHGYHGNITTFPWQDCHYDNTVTTTTRLPWQHYIVTVDNSTCFAIGSITRLPWRYHNVSLTGLSLWQHCQYDNTVTLTTLHCHGWQQYLFCEWQHHTVTMAISQHFLDRTVTMTTLSLWQHCHYDNTVTMATLHCHGWQQYLFCEWQHHTVTMAISQHFLDRTVTMTTLSLWQHCHYDNTVTMTTLHCHGWQQYLFCEWQHYTVTMAISQRFLDRTVTMTTLSLRQHSYLDNTTLSRLTTVPVLWMAASHGYHGNITTFPWQDCHYDNTVTMTTLSLWQHSYHDNTTLSRLTTVPVLRMAALHGYHGNITTFPWQDCHYDNTVTMRTLSNVNMTTQLPWQHYIVTVDNSTCFANGSITRLPWQYHNVSLTGLSLWQHCHYDNTVNMTTQLPWQHYIVTVDNSTCFANGSITRLPWQYHNVSLTGLSLWQHCHYDNTVTMATLHCHGWQQYLFCEWQHYTVTMAISQRFLDRTVTMTTLSLWQHCHYDNTVTLTTLHCHGWQQYLFCEWQHYTVTMAISQRFLDRTVTMTTLSLWQHSYHGNTTLSRLTTVPVLRMAALHGYHGNITTFPWQDCHYDNTVTMTTQLPWQHYIVTVDNSTCFVNGSITRLPWQYHNVSLTGLSLWQHCQYDNTVTMTTLSIWQHYIVTVDNSTCFANGSITRLPWQYHNVSLTGLSLWQHCHYDNTVTMTTLHCHGWQQYLFCEWQHYTVTMAISQRFLDRTVTMTTLSLRQHGYHDTVTMTWTAMIDSLMWNFMSLMFFYSLRI